MCDPVGLTKPASSTSINEALATINHTKPFVQSQSSEQAILTTNMSSEQATTAAPASEAPNRKRKTPAKKETQNFAACHARNAIGPVKGTTHSNEESLNLLAAATQDYVVRLVEKASSYGNERKNMKNTITAADIIRATQEEAMVVPDYIFDNFSPKVRKPRMTKAMKIKASQLEEEEKVGAAEIAVDV